MYERFRILHVLRAPVGGLFRHVRDLAAEQSARGHEVGFLADALTSDSLTETRLADIAPQLALGIHRIEMPRKPGLADLRAVMATKRIAETLDIDILHGHGAKGGTYARLAAAVMRLTSSNAPSSFYTPHGGSLHYRGNGPVALAYRSVERMLGRLTDGLIFECSFARRAYEAGIDRAIIGSKVIPNGLVESDFGTHNPSPDAADFLFIGELRTLKGVDLLLNALHRLNRTRKVTAVIVGDGPDASQFKTLAHELGLDDCVTFPGAMPAREAFDLGRVLVMPSRAESFPYVVLECAAVAMPIIATDVGGVHEIVAETDTELVESDNVDALTAAMDAELQDMCGARARSERLKAKVLSRFTVARMTTSILSYYADCREGYARPANVPVGETI